MEIPRPPDHVKTSKEANREWKRITAELARYGLVSKLDRAELAFYCICWARHCEAEDMIEKAAAASGGSGLFVKTPNGFPVQSPWVAVSNKAMELCHTFLQDYGLNPASRTRVAQSDNYFLPGMEPTAGEAAQQPTAKVTSLADFARR